MDKLVHAHLIKSNMGDYRPLFRAFMDWLEANQKSVYCGGKHVLQVGGR